MANIVMAINADSQGALATNTSGTPGNQTGHQSAASDEERMAVYRRVRDEIRDMVANFEERVVKA